MIKVWLVVLTVSLAALGGCASDGDSYQSGSGSSRSSHGH